MLMNFSLSTDDPLVIALIIAAITIVAAVVLLTLVCAILLPSRRKISTKQWSTSHCLVTGGSSGIGKELVRNLIRCGVKEVTIVARNKAKLSAAQKEFTTYARSRPNQSSAPTTIHVLSLDLSLEYGVIETSIDKHVSETSEITNLFLCAGSALARVATDTPPTSYHGMMSSNFYTCTTLIKILLPKLTSNAFTKKNPSSILITSSAAGQIGIYGYTAYSASKFALKGYSDALRLELAGKACNLTIAFPPNTDTPGFEEENKGKPEITKYIEDGAGLWSAESVADGMVEAVAKGYGFKYFGVDGWMLHNVTAGMGEVDNMADFVIQVFFGGLLRFIGICYGWMFRGIAKKSA